MPFLLSVTLASGEVLDQKYEDRETLDADVRCIERWRAAGLDLPTIAWTTTGNKKWVLSATDMVGPLRVHEMAPAEAVAG